MDMPLINTFLLLVMRWLELGLEKKPELLDKMECFTECLA